MRAAALAPLAAAAVVGLFAGNAAADVRARANAPPRGRMVEAGDQAFHVLERGEGSPVLLIHGNLVTAYDRLFSGILDRLAQQFRAIAPDRPGFGFSPRVQDRSWTAQARAGALAGLLDALGAAPVFVVGHSYGTLVACELALAAPEKVRGLALLSGYFRPTLRLDALGAAPLAAPALGPVLSHTLGALSASLTWPAMEKTLFAPARVASSFRRSPTDLALRPSQLRASGQDGAVMAFDAARLVRRLTDLPRPVSILAGADDRVVDAYAQSGWLAERLPGASLTLIDGCGHMLHHTAPRVVADTLAKAAERAR